MQKGRRWKEHSETTGLMDEAVGDREEVVGTERTSFTFERGSSSESNAEVPSSVVWAFGFCNFSVLWAYQSLLSAQEYYELQFPDANISFLTNWTST